jgi:nucleoside-diphosphate-sugar epimerase
MLRIKAPIWLLRIICTVNGTFNTWRGKTTTLNQDKFHILSQRNWQCDIEPARKGLGYQPEYSLERGVKETIAWYKKEGWL